MANQTNRDQEILELKTQIAALEQRLSVLEPKAPAEPVRQPWIERPVTIVQLAAPQAPAEAWPDDLQIARLQEIVLTRTDSGHIAYPA